MNKNSGKCQDCLGFYERDNSPESVSTTTTETREGKGLWVKCKNCNLVINRSGVSLEEFESFYNEDYVNHNSLSTGQILSARKRFDERLSNIEVIANGLIPYLNNDMNIVEIGAATGELLFLLKDKVKSCFAFEINKGYSEFIQRELKIPSSYEDYSQVKFENERDFIISINTIDHMFDSLGVVKKIFNDLNNGGYFYVEVPNDEQALKSFLPYNNRTKFKSFMYQKAHYYSFSFQTLTEALRNIGFDIVFEKSRHDYTLINYLNWYFLGEPQKKFKSALEETSLHMGNSEFEKDMNELMKHFNGQFKELMSRHKVGESICVLARKPIS